MQVHLPQVCSATLLLPWPILPLQEATLPSLGSSPKTVVPAASQESAPRGWAAGRVGRPWASVEPGDRTLCGHPKGARTSAGLSPFTAGASPSPSAPRPLPGWPSPAPFLTAGLLLCGTVGAGHWLQGF